MKNQISDKIIHQWWIDAMGMFLDQLGNLVNVDEIRDADTDCTIEAFYGEYFYN